MRKPRRTKHQHRWDITTLEDDFIPGIPTYVTRCACGAAKPPAHAPVSVAPSAA